MEESQHSPKSPSSITFHAACTSTTCQNCGGPTQFPTPPPTWSEISPPPNYRPIRAPAINLPPNHTQQEIMLTPVPQAQRIDVVSPPYHFQTPTKRIQSIDDVKKFHESDTCKNFLGFVVALSDSVRGMKISDPCHESRVVTSVARIMETLINWVDEIPPVQQSSRYGNYAFREWQNRLSENGEDLMLRVLDSGELSGAVVEIS